MILDDCCGDADGNFFVVAVEDIDFQINDGLRGLSGMLQWAGLKAGVGPEDLVAVLANGFILGKTSDSLCSFVERGNPPLMIDGKDSVSDTI
jgi:hypothetical protein